jgi:hypothetical protein
MYPTTAGLWVEMGISLSAQTGLKPQSSQSITQELLGLQAGATTPGPNINVICKHLQLPDISHISYYFYLETVFPESKSKGQA